MFKIFLRHITLILGISCFTLFLFGALPNIHEVQIENIISENKIICKTSLERCKFILFTTLILLPLGFILTYIGITNALGWKNWNQRGDLSEGEILGIMPVYKVSRTDNIDILIKGSEIQEEREL